MTVMDDLKTAMGTLDEDAALELARTIVASGADAQDALVACQEGMNTVGTRFSEGEYFVGDLIYAGEIMNEVMEILAPAIAAAGSPTDKQEKIILGTVVGDLHDIGKNIVKSTMEASGFEVIDLGIDVEPEAFVTAVKENDATIVALSGVLTLAIDSMKATVQAFEEAGIRQDVHIIIGGAPVNAEVCTLVGADAWAVSPYEDVEICRKWIS